MTHKSNFKGILPLLIFISIYLGTGILLHIQGTSMAFYQLPAPIAMFVAIIFAFMMFQGSLNDKIHLFLKGCGQEDIMIMCIIYLLAGAFSLTTKEIGGIDAAVNLGLNYISPQYIAVGVFLIAAFISTATGTSVGAIVTLGPIAIGLAQKSGINLPLILASLMGGSMFGDNLSIISDTTIAATRTQGVAMKDKFRFNFMLAVPAAFITIIGLIVFGSSTSPNIAHEIISINPIKLLPYIMVIGLALSGMHVFLVLFFGILCSGIIGLVNQDFTLMQYSQHIYTGFTNMTEIFLLSLLTGGLSMLVLKEGGIQWFLEQIQKFIKGPKTAQLGIGALVSLTDIAVANNTVAILINGNIAKEISNKYHVDSRRSATILDVFSCIFQGLIPYGAQMLILLQFTEGMVSYIDILPFLWYQGLLFIVIVLSILFNNYQKNPQRV